MPGQRFIPAAYEMGEPGPLIVPEIARPSPVGPVKCPDRTPEIGFMTEQVPPVQIPLRLAPLMCGVVVPNVQFARQLDREWFAPEDIATVSGDWMEKLPFTDP